MDYTKLLLHFDGTDGSTNFVDSSPSNHTVTASGDVQIDTAQYKFGGSSALFDGTGDFQVISDSDDWDFGSGDFTVDCWVRLNSLSICGIFGQYTDSLNTWYLGLYQYGAVNRILIRQKSETGDTFNIYSNWTPSLNTWYHLAFVREGNNWYIFVDGESLSLTGAGSYTFDNFSSSAWIGREAEHANSYLDGWLDELRISKGIARWTANFTPPTRPYAYEEDLVNDFRFSKEEEIDLTNDFRVSELELYNITNEIITRTEEEDDITNKFNSVLSDLSDITNKIITRKSVEDDIINDFRNREEIKYDITNDFRFRESQEELYDIVEEFRMSAYGGDYITKTLYAGEVVGTDTNASEAYTSFSPIDCTGLEKVESYIIVELKCDTPAKMAYGAFELTSSGGWDNNEWYIDSSDWVGDYGITTNYKEVTIPLDDATTQGGELDVSAINFARWFMFSDDGSLAKVYWRNLRVQYRTTNKVDMTNKFNSAIQVISDWTNQFRMDFTRYLSDIANIISTRSQTVYDIENKCNIRKASINDITNDFRMVTSAQATLIANDVSGLGKEYITVKINGIDITESLNVDIDSIRWKEVLNDSWEADMNLALPYDSASSPSLEDTVEILFNDNRKFYGKIRRINKTSDPENIAIHAEAHYYDLKEDIVDLEIGHYKDYDTYKEALVYLGFDYDIGDFTPINKDFLNSSKADTITAIVRDCGSYNWYIDQNGTYQLWIGGKGGIVTLDRQEIGTNFNIYQILSHDVNIDTDTPVIDNVKVKMGDTVIPGYDNEHIELKSFVIFQIKPLDDANIYHQTYPENIQYYNIPRIKDTYEKVKYGWKGIVSPDSYNFDVEYPTSERPEYVEHREWYLTPNFREADENMKDVAWSYYTFRDGGKYPTITKENVFYVGTTGAGTVSKELDLNTLNKQLGTTYSRIEKITPDSYQYTMQLLDEFGVHGGNPLNYVDIGGGYFAYSITPAPFTKQKSYHFIPSWDDTDYATDIANWELTKYNTTKYRGSITVTIDCADFYGINLKKRIKSSGLLDETMDINSIEYDMGNYTATIELESRNFYRRTVNYPVHLEEKST